MTRATETTIVANSAKAVEASRPIHSHEMRVTRVTCSLVISICCAAPTASAQSVIRIYEVFEGNGIKATFVTVSADGTKTTASYSAHFDGKEYPYTGSSTLSSISLKRVDAYTWAATNKGKTVSTGTNTVSKDGKTLTWSYKGTNAQGQPVSGVQVFERQ